MEKVGYTVDAPVESARDHVPAFSPEIEEKDISQWKTGTGNESKQDRIQASGNEGEQHTIKGNGCKGRKARKEGDYKGDNISISYTDPVVKKQWLFL